MMNISKVILCAAPRLTGRVSSDCTTCIAFMVGAVEPGAAAAGIDAAEQSREPSGERKHDV
jgi:hypothetical protein